jgi:DHA3 family macrolide efflux protein-like MFS transporter
MTVVQAPHKLSSFIVIWFGQVLSVIGSNLTGFALSVWVYQHTGSVTKFSIVILFTALPGIVVSPLAGTLVDMWDRRLLMILSNLWAAASTLSVAWVFFASQLRLWHICFFAAAVSVSSAVISPAFSASISLLVPKRHLGRASGMMQFGEATAQIAAPLLGGFLILTVKIYGVLLLDFITYFVAVVTLLIVRVPSPKADVRETGDNYSLLRAAALGWNYIFQRPGLFGLLVFFAVTNFTASMSNVLITPLILSFANAAVYGTVIAAAGVGLLAGSLLMSIWGGPRQRIYGVFGYGFLLGLTLILEGLRPHALLIGVALFIGGCIAPVANGCIMPILQSKTHPEIQGRVFAAVRLVAWCSIPVAYLAAGPLADKVFGPLLNVDGPLAGSIGKVIGVGPGRGIGFLLILLGLITVLATLRASFYPRLINVDAEIPDIIIDKVTAEA